MIYHRDVKKRKQQDDASLMESVKQVTASTTIKNNEKHWKKNVNSNQTGAHSRNVS